MPLRIISIILLTLSAALLILKIDALTEFYLAISKYEEPFEDSIQFNYLLMSVGLGMGIVAISMLAFNCAKMAMAPTWRLAGIGTAIVLLVGGILLTLGVLKFAWGITVLGIGAGDERVSQLINEMINVRLHPGAILFGLGLLGSGVVMAFGAKVPQEKRLPIAMPIIMAVFGVVALGTIPLGYALLDAMAVEANKGGSGDAMVLAEYLVAIAHMERTGAVALLLLGITTTITFIIWPRAQA